MPDFTRSLGPSTKSLESVQQAQSWLHQCTSSHKICSAIVGNSGTFVPERLVQILSGPGPSLALRVAHTREWKRRPVRPYATLSHCWGRKVQCRLLRANVDQYSRALPAGELSSLFRDAISVAQQLGIRYLWIDSLCIIQDSRQDWVEQSAQMGMIYKNGLINIAATGFSDGSRGLFGGRNLNTILPIELTIEDNLDWTDGSQDPKPQRFKDVKKGPYLLFDVDSYSKGVDDGPLNRRGWVVQERSLSLRTLHFGARQLFWECAELEASDVFPSGFVRGMPTNSPKLFIQTRSDLTREEQHRLGASHLRNGSNFILGETRPDPSPVDMRVTPVHVMTAAHVRWIQLVKIYSRCDLTFSSDKLVAIAGLARDLSPYIKTEYYAGLWLKGFMHQLCWWVTKRRPSARLDALRGPSWSWASVDGVVTMSQWPQSKQQEAGQKYYEDRGKLQWHARLLGVSVQPANGDRFGQIASGVATITGFLGVLHIGPQNEEEEPSPHPDSGALEQIRTRPRIFWDDTEPEDRFGPSGDAFVWRYSAYGSKMSKKKGRKGVLKPSDVFFLPIRTMGEHEGYEWEDDTLLGLLLLPTGQARGQYRRAGVLRLSHHWRGREGSIPQFMSPTKIWSPDFYEQSGESGWYRLSIV